MDFVSSWKRHLDKLSVTSSVLEPSLFYSIAVVIADSPILKHFICLIFSVVAKGDPQEMFSGLVTITVDRKYKV